MLDQNNHLNADSRICLLTTRGFALNAFRCGFYEAQDVLVDIDRVDLIYLEPKPSYDFRKDLHEKMIWRDHTHKMLNKNLTIQPIQLKKEYDLFIVYLPYFQDIIHLPAIQNWKTHCKTSILWVNELWIKDVDNPKFAKTWLTAFDQFDHIALGLAATAKRLQEILKRPCEFVPTGIDALRFNSYPEIKPRCIDIYSMGRSWQDLHKSLLYFSTKQNLFYFYDTFNTGGTQIKDYQQHRTMLANIIKRACYFIVAPAKIDATNETAGQIEIGARYFEGAAAGAILLGQAPQCEAFQQLFNWPDAVIEVQTDGSDVADLLSSLAKQPDRLLAMSLRNTSESLLRHDWMYRWHQILNLTGLEPSPKLASRKNTLQTKALEIKNENQTILTN